MNTIDFTEYSQRVGYRTLSQRFLEEVYRLQYHRLHKKPEVPSVEGGWEYIRQTGTNKQIWYRSM